MSRLRTAGRDPLHPKNHYEDGTGTSPRIAPAALAGKLRRLSGNGISPSAGTVEDLIECLDWCADAVKAAEPFSRLPFPLPVLTR